MQAGGGAAGMIIVEDKVGALPDQIANLEEMVFVGEHEPRLELVTARALEKGDGEYGAALRAAAAGRSLAHAPASPRAA